MSNRLDREIKKLCQRVDSMAGAVQQALKDSVAALQDVDADAARIVCESDRKINDQRFSLESDAIAVIATQQPVAADVRLLVGILEIATELERMGDYAKDIGRIAIRGASQRLPKPAISMVSVAGDAAHMLEQAMESFADVDAERATTIAGQDDTIDGQCLELHRCLVTSACRDGVALDQAMLLLPAVHNIERFADRVTNICERIVYIATGKSVEFDDQMPSQ